MLPSAEDQANVSPFWSCPTPPVLFPGTNGGARRAGSSPGPAHCLHPATSLWREVLSGPRLGDSHHGSDGGVLLPWPQPMTLQCRKPADLLSQQAVPEQDDSKHKTAGRVPSRQALFSGCVLNNGAFMTTDKGGAIIVTVQTGNTA